MSDNLQIVVCVESTIPGKGYDKLKFIGHTPSGDFDLLCLPGDEWCAL